MHGHVAPWIAIRRERVVRHFARFGNDGGGAAEVSDVATPSAGIALGGWYQG